MGLWAIALWLLAVGLIALFFLVPRARVAVAVAVVLALVLGVASYKLRKNDVHLTACGFNAQGAYAKVRVDNWLSFSSDKRHVDVTFALEGGRPLEQGGYGGLGRRLEAPALGHATSVFQGRFPPRTKPTSQVSEGSDGPRTLPGPDPVAGHTVYRFIDQGHSRFVSREFARSYSGPGVVRVETVPADPQSLRCSVSVWESSEAE